jgi:hypothetical protein
MVPQISKHVHLADRCGVVSMLQIVWTTSFPLAFGVSLEGKPLDSGERYYTVISQLLQL